MTAREPSAGQAPPDPVAPDPRAVRVSLAPASRLEGDPVVVVGPAPGPAPDGSASPDPSADPVAGPGPAPAGAQVGATDSAPAAAVLVDGRPVVARLDWLDEQRVVLVRSTGREAERSRVLLGPARAQPDRGAAVREVVVDGWRFELELEPERRAILRERARRGREAAGHGGPLEIRSIIPGRIVAVLVSVGDLVQAGQQLLVLEAMKMQNEIRAPREGRVERVLVGVGQAVELGDLLAVIG